MAEHGTRARYTNGRCRCAKCRKVHNEAMRAYRHKGTIPEGVTHGLRTTYTNHGCRCPDCRAANSIFKKQKYLAQQRSANSGENL